MVNEETKKEVDKVLRKELRMCAESLVSEVISVRSSLCLLFPNDREKIVEAFSELLFDVRTLKDKAERVERRR